MKPLFNRKHLLGLKALIFLLLSVMLMIANKQMQLVIDLRPTLSMLVLPIQEMVDKPMQFLNWLETSVVTQEAVLGENTQLKAKQLLLEARLQRLIALEHENQQLRELLTSSMHVAGKMRIAQLLAVDSSPLNQEVTLDKGSREGVFVGQPILDASGLMGQVVSVTPFTSQAMLISDSRSAIPVQNNRNGMRSVVVGAGYADQLNLLNVSVTADIAVGDLLVTSGLGGRFPFGYPVGRVASIQKSAGERFALIQVVPAARLSKSLQVILLWPLQEQSVNKAEPSRQNKSKQVGKH